jgi:hypothetical protein
MPAEENRPMLQPAHTQMVAPCPMCGTDMVLAVITPHPVSPQLGRHTYLCARCNQTKTYILPAGPSANSETSAGGPDRSVMREDPRREPRETLDAAGTIYHKEGSFLLPCTVRDLSRTGARLELFKEAVLPQYFLLSLMPDGSAKRLCSKVWQIALVAGVRFVEKQAT